MFSMITLRGEQGAEMLSPHPSRTDGKHDLFARSQCGLGHSQAHGAFQQMKKGGS